MKRILPILLIVIGITEMILAWMNVKMPVMVAMALGMMFLALGVKTLFEAGKKK